MASHIRTSIDVCGELVLRRLLKVFHKEVSDDRRKRGAHSHSVCLLVELAINREECRTEDKPK
jgi:hypothetical protein